MKDMSSNPIKDILDALGETNKTYKIKPREIFIHEWQTPIYLMAYGCNIIEDVEKYIINSQIYPESVKFVVL